MTSGSMTQLHKPRKFRFLKQFDEPGFDKKTMCSDRLRESDTRWFPGNYLSSIFAQALCRHEAIPFKEVLESFEFYACVRNEIRCTEVADLCCGHGLVGVMFAMFERAVERVTLLDKVRPASFDAVLAAAVEVAPWVAAKLQYVVGPASAAAEHLAAKTAILGVHACGHRTDVCIREAIRLNGPVAVLPCCRQHRSHASPECLKQVLGADVAIDVDRTYRLFNAGYHVRWDTIPESISPMNRVLMGSPKAE